MGKRRDEWAMVIAREREMVTNRLPNPQTVGGNGSPCPSGAGRYLEGLNVRGSE